MRTRYRVKTRVFAVFGRTEATLGAISSDLGRLTRFLDLV